MYFLKELRMSTLTKGWNCAKRIGKEIHHLSLFVFFDICFCTLFYGAGYCDYESFEFYHLNFLERKRYLTRRKNNKIVKRCNCRDKYYYMDQKHLFDLLFSTWVKRKWIYLPDHNVDEFCVWASSFLEVMAKPDQDCGGHGIEKIRLSQFSSLKDCYQYCYQKKLFLLEEVIVQHSQLADLYPDSVNTLRVITLLHHQQVFIVTAFLRVGNGHFVDNTCSGGLIIPIDWQNGMTVAPATDMQKRVYYYHSITHKNVLHQEIPYFDQVKKMIEEIPYLLPDIGYVAWDIAITKEGVELIEGNCYPGYYYQFPAYQQKGYGYYQKIVDILRSHAQISLVFHKRMYNRK